MSSPSVPAVTETQPSNQAAASDSSTEGAAAPSSEQQMDVDPQEAGPSSQTTENKETSTPGRMRFVKLICSDSVF